MYCYESLTVFAFGSYLGTQETKEETCDMEY